jgi:hypothetical protein
MCSVAPPIPQNDTFADSCVDVDSVVDFGGDPLGFAAERDGPLTALTRVANRQLLGAFLAYERPLEECSDAMLGLPDGAAARASGRALAAEPAAELAGAGAMWRRVERRLRPALRAHARDEEVLGFESQIRGYLSAEAAGAQQQRGGCARAEPEGEPPCERASQSCARLAARACVYALP